MVTAESDPDLKLRLDLLEADITGFEALEARLSKEHVQLNDAARSAMMKLRASELHQEITEVALEAAPHDEKALAKYFFTRAATIYSGTSEIHRNSLARAIGCP